MTQNLFTIGLEGDAASLHCRQSPMTMTVLLRASVEMYLTSPSGCRHSP